MSNASLEQKTTEITKLLAPFARLVLLFGSYATGTAHETSDIDIAISGGALLTPPIRLELVGELEAIHPAGVSLVQITPTSDPLLVMEIVSHAKVLYAADSNVWPALKFAALQQYEDTRRLRELEITAIKAGIKKVLKKLE